MQCACDIRRWYHNRVARAFAARFKVIAAIPLFIGCFFKAFGVVCFFHVLSLYIVGKLLKIRSGIILNSSGNG